jgi:hypothetical protein
MNPADFERPLSELYSETQRRLRAREVDLILARHRMNFESHRLLAEAERLDKIKVSL